MADEMKELNLPENHEEEPQVFTIVRNVNGSRYTRRNFIEKAAVTSAAATVVISGCSFNAPKPVDMQATVNAAVAATDAAKKPQIAAEAVTKAARPTATHTATAVPTETQVPPTTTSTIEPTPAGIESSIKGDNVNFRAGPGTGYAPITRLPSGTAITLVSRLQDSSWVGVALRDPKQKGKVIQGWIKTNLVETRGKDIQSLRVITDIPPTPTPLPGKYGQTGAGQTGLDYEYTDEYGNVFKFTLPCGSPLPAGAVCTCNCVTVPRSCSCDGHTCSDCGCDALHYWYPN